MLVWTPLSRQLCCCTSFVPPVDLLKVLSCGFRRPRLMQSLVSPRSLWVSLNFLFFVSCLHSVVLIDEPELGTPDVSYMVRKAAHFYPDGKGDEYLPNIIRALCNNRYRVPASCTCTSTHRRKLHSVLDRSSSESGVTGSTSTPLHGKAALLPFTT
jgi:hypothetical protein